MPHAVNTTICKYQPYSEIPTCIFLFNNATGNGHVHLSIVDVLIEVSTFLKLELHSGCFKEQAELFQRWITLFAG